MSDNIDTVTVVVGVRYAKAFPSLQHAIETRIIDGIVVLIAPADRDQDRRPKAIYGFDASIGIEIIGDQIVGITIRLLSLQPSMVLLVTKVTMFK